MGYMPETDTYKCDFCGFEEEWDASDEAHGDMWSCDECGATFCSKCLQEKVGGWGHYSEVMREYEEVLCPNCIEEREKENENVQ